MKPEDGHVNRNMWLSVNRILLYSKYLVFDGNRINTLRTGDADLRF